MTEIADLGNMSMLWYRVWLRGQHASKHARKCAVDGLPEANNGSTRARGLRIGATTPNANTFRRNTFERRQIVDAGCCPVRRHYNNIRSKSGLVVSTAVALLLPLAGPILFCTSSTTTCSPWCRSKRTNCRRPSGKRFSTSPRGCPAWRHRWHCPEPGWAQKTWSLSLLAMAVSTRRS